MKIDIHLKSFDKISLELYCSFLKELLKKIQKVKYNKLPKQKKRISILKSPHVNKKAFEQFQIETHSIRLTLFNIQPKLIKFLLVNKPQNVSLKYKILEKII